MGSCFSQPLNGQSNSNNNNQHNFSDLRESDFRNESITTTVSAINQSNLIHSNYNPHNNIHTTSNILTSPQNVASSSQLSQTTNNSVNRKDLYVAVYDYDARGHQDLSFKTGDSLIIKNPE